MVVGVSFLPYLREVTRFRSLVELVLLLVYRRIPFQRTKFFLVRVLELTTRVRVGAPGRRGGRDLPVTVMGVRGGRQRVRLIPVQ